MEKLKHLTATGRFEQQGEIGLALALVQDQLAADLLRWTYADDPTVLHTLHLGLTNRISEKWIRDNRGGQALEIALGERQRPTVCPQCDGTGVQHCHNRIGDCMKCNGTGKVPYSNTQRAKRMGITYRAFTKTWAERYALMHEFMDDLEHTGRRQVERLLRRPLEECYA